MENALSYLKQLPSTKEEINDFAIKASREVLDGNTNALEVYHTCKCISETMNKIMDNIKGSAVEEADKWKGQPYKGAKIETMDTVKYDYASSDDAQWIKLNTEIEILTAQKKKREGFLKSLQEPVFDGDGIEVKPPIKKTSGITIKITL
jgi:hypothetical protein